MRILFFTIISKSQKIVLNAAFSYFNIALKFTEVKTIDE